MFLTTGMLFVLVALGLVVWATGLAALGAVHTALAWAAGRRAGDRGLVAAWLAATLVTGSAAVLWYTTPRQTYLVSEYPPPHHAFRLALGLLVAAAGFGGTTAWVRRRIARGTALGVGGAAVGGAVTVAAAVAAALVLSPLYVARVVLYP